MGLTLIMLKETIYFDSRHMIYRAMPRDLLIILAALARKYEENNGRD